MRKPLIALAVSAFGIGTTEFIIMGLLPDLARSFRVSIPKAGSLVSVYALSVTLGSPLVALALSRVDRKRALMLLMALFVIGNAACAAAPTFGLLMAARILTALTHGSFFGIGSIVAANVVPREQRARAVALMFSGLTLANVLGVPAGTALGQAYGWRAAFLAIVPLGIIAALGILWLVPHQPGEPVRLIHELRSVMRKQVQLVLALSTLSSVAMFCVLTYITPILETVTHVSPHGVTGVLVLFGVAITIGNLLGGLIGDWKQLQSIVAGFALLTLLFAAMPFAEPHLTPALVAISIWGVLHFALGAPLQTRVVDQAKGAQNLASTLNQGAFNLGNAIGASLGALVLTQGLGYRKLSFASAAVTLIGVCIALLALRVEKHEQPCPRPDLFCCLPWMAAYNRQGGRAMIRILVRFVNALLVVATLVYAADYAVWRIRMIRGTGTATMDVSRVSIAPLKGGKEEYYFDGTGTAICTRSMLPLITLYGWGTPCWWLRPHRQVVTRY